MGMVLRPDTFVIVRVLGGCCKLGDLESVDGCMTGFGIGRNIFLDVVIFITLTNF